ncbi:MAG: nucleotidyltransferase domain-containing protein [Chloroflexi bacterium]|nr:nucleotidyltransferase domain-containing protein [Chloroflexota bacterium]
MVARFPEVTLAYLFGSRVGGPVGPRSDYDIAVLIEDARGLSALRARLAHELAVALATERVDVVILNRAPVELAYAVIAQGIPVYQRDTATRVEYEARVMGLYGDYLPVLRAQRRDILRGDQHAARVQRYRAALGRTQRKIGAIRASQGEGPG